MPPSNNKDNGLCPLTSSVSLIVIAEKQLRPYSQGSLSVYTISLQTQNRCNFSRCGFESRAKASAELLEGFPHNLSSLHLSDQLLRAALVEAAGRRGQTPGRSGETTSSCPPVAQASAPSLQEFRGASSLTKAWRRPKTAAGNRADVFTTEHRQVVTSEGSLQVPPQQLEQQDFDSS